MTSINDISKSFIYKELTYRIIEDILFLVKLKPFDIFIITLFFLNSRIDSLDLYQSGIILYIFFRVSPFY